MTEVLRVDPRDPDPAAIAHAAACLRGGGLVAFPTETRSTARREYACSISEAQS